MHKAAAMVFKRRIKIPSSFGFVPPSPADLFLLSRFRFDAVIGTPVRIDRAGAPAHQPS
jgi:hypothetical protein